MDLRNMTLPGLKALANRLADDCRRAAARGDDSADSIAFERLLVVLAELTRREEAATPTPFGIADPSDRQV